MARKVHIQYPGAIHQVMNRGDLPLSGVAERLHMGRRGHLARMLERRGKSRLAVPTDQCVLGI